MLITFPCPKCRASLEIEADTAGTAVACPQCGTNLTVPKKGIEPGTTIQGFHIERILGHGGMGTVYLARQLSLDRLVALKILLPEYTAHESHVQRFLNEVRLAARLQHPNVVATYEAGEDGAVRFLAMEYVPGTSLDLALRRQGPMQEGPALRLVAKLAQALAYAWNKHHIIHRDIKPANILLDEDGEPKLADMGLSKSLDDRGQTISGTIMGTPNYMSPEQVEGLSDVDCRTDMYSLGATLYHMLTGHVPFAGSSIADTLRKQVMEELPDPRDANPAISEQTVDLLQILLAKDRDERYADWETLIGDIEYVLAGKPPSVVVPGAGRSVLLPGKGANKVVVPRKAPQPAAAPAAVPKARSPWSLVAAGTVVLVLVMGVVLWAVLGREKPTNPESRVAAAQPATATPAVQPPPAVVVAPPAVPAQPVVPAPKPVEPKPATEAPPAPATVPAVAPEVTPPVPVKVTEPSPPEAAPAKVPALLDALAGDLLRFDWTAAQNRIRQAEKDTAISGSAEWQAVREAGTQAARLPDMILESYARDKGKEIPVRLKKGTETVQIVSVQGEQVKAQKLIREDGQVIAQVELNFGYADLSPAERMARLGTAPGAERAVMRGLIALHELGSAEQAAACFKEGQGPLCAALAKQLERRKTEKAEQEAEAALKSVMALTDVAGDWADPANLADNVSHKAYTADEVKRLAGAAAAYTTRYGQSATAKKYEALLQALGAVSSEPPARPRPATDEEVRKALARLAEDNPQIKLLDYKREVKPEGIVLDLSHNPKLTDIRALAGLPLVELILGDTGVSRIDALHKMPLKKLILSGTSVRNLTPISGLPLEELGLDHTPVATLDALKGLPLKRLSLAGTLVTTLDALKGLPLKDLDIGHSKTIHDLPALAGMELNTLSAEETPLTDADLAAAVKGKVLAEEMGRLQLARTKITSIETLKEISVNWLGLSETAVTDLSPLNGRRWFACLDLAATKVSDLKPLAGMQIQRLLLNECPITSISPLADVQLNRELNIAFCTRIKDLDKLPECCPGLEQLDFAPGQVSPEFIRRFPRLQRVMLIEAAYARRDTWSVADFLKNPPRPKGK